MIHSPSDMKYTDWTSGEPVEKEWPDQPTPRTEAGRRVYDRDRIHNQAQRTRADDKHDARLLADILVIEAQARTEALDVDALREAVFRVDHVAAGTGWVELVAREYAAILAAKADR